MTVRRCPTPSLLAAAVLLLAAPPRLRGAAVLPTADPVQPASPDAPRLVVDPDVLVPAGKPTLTAKVRDAAKTGKAKTALAALAPLSDDLDGIEPTRVSYAAAGGVQWVRFDTAGDTRNDHAVLCFFDAKGRFLCTDILFEDALGDGGAPFTVLQRPAGDGIVYYRTSRYYGTGAFGSCLRVTTLRPRDDGRWLRRDASTLYQEGYLDAPHLAGVLFPAARIGRDIDSIVNFNLKCTVRVVGNDVIITRRGTVHLGDPETTADRPGAAKHTRRIDEVYTIDADGRLSPAI